MKHGGQAGNMFTLKLWYSIQNGGDGSAYPQFFESEALCRFDQDNMDEGWGEPCLGCIELQSESPITLIRPSITTIEEYAKEIKERMEWASDKTAERLSKQLEQLKAMK